MKNLTGYETYLKSGRVNEQALKGGSKSFIREIAAQNGVDPEELLMMVQGDLEDTGMSESVVNEMIGADGLVTLSDFFILFPSVIAGLVTLALGGTRLEGWARNKKWIKIEAEQRVKAMIKKDGSLIDKQAELIAKVTDELKNDPMIQAKLKKAKWEGGLDHPSIKRDRSTYKTHIFGGGY
jgi:hypothetical protein